MIARLKFALCGLGMLLAFQPLARAQTSPSFDRQKLDTYLNKLQQENKFMGSVAIDSAGHQVYARSVGYRRLGQDSVKANAETRYRVGSVTKMFTATMVMQLVEEGKLTLSTRLAEFYPKIPQADSITIKQMLSHRSGLYNFTNAPDYSNWMTEPRTKEQMLELFRGQQSAFSPGSQTSYSNTNFVLLGYIIENITGQSYDEQLQQRIAGPLGLTHTYYGDGIDPQKNEAVSFRFATSQWQPTPETDMSIPGGAGAIVSTPGELTDFVRALFKGKLVSQHSLDAMTTIRQQLGLGLMKIPFYDTYAYGHNGGIDGFQANLSYFPEEDVAVALTGNGFNYSMNNILIGMLSIYFGRPFDIPSFDTPTITLNSKQMQQFVGQYDSEQIPLEIKVFVKDSTLMAQGTGQSPFPLTATNETTLRFERAGIVMEFDSLAGDKYQQFILHQGSGSVPFTRKK